MLINYNAVVAYITEQSLHILCIITKLENSIIIIIIIIPKPRHTLLYKTINAAF